MLTFDYIHQGRSLSLELPVPIEILTGELRALGVNERLRDIHRADFMLQPTNELGEHFMKIVQPDDTLYAIAAASQEFVVLDGDSRQALVDLLKTDRLKDLDHMADYLRYGSAALDHYIRLNLGERQIDLPAPAAELREALLTAGFAGQPNNVSLRELDIIPINEQGKQLLIELSSYESLAMANLGCALLTVPDITASMRQVVESARGLLPPQPTQSLTFYCPLTLQVEDEDGEDLVEDDPAVLVYHEGEISEALREVLPKGENMAQYLRSHALKDKVASMQWDVARLYHTLYGSIYCELRAPLSIEEKAELAEWISGQNADGLGEIFEQHPVETDDGDLYVSLWHSGEHYFVLEQSRFEDFLNGGWQAIGMTPPKPDCPMVGQDGNIFHLMGLAARALRENGLTDQATEMRERVTASGDYYKGLGIIGEYVNITAVDNDLDEDEDEDWCREPEYDEEEEQGFGGIGGMS